MNEREPKKNPRSFSYDLAYRRGARSAIACLLGLFLVGGVSQLVKNAIVMGFWLSVPASIGITLSLYGVVNGILFLLNPPPDLKK